MNDQEVLTKAIKVALANGWKFQGQEDTTYLPPQDWIIPGSVAAYNSYLKDKVYIPYNVILFSHDFARALWGEEPKGVWITEEDDKQLLVAWSPQYQNHFDYYLPNWQQHLQQMVIADNPISYLAEHMP